MRNSVLLFVCLANARSRDLVPLELISALSANKHGSSAPAPIVAVGITGHTRDAGPEIKKTRSAYRVFSSIAVWSRPLVSSKQRFELGLVLMID